MFKILISFSLAMAFMACDERERSSAVSPDAHVVATDGTSQDMAARDAMPTPDSNSTVDLGVSESTCTDEPEIRLAESEVNFEYWGEERAGPVSVEMTVLGQPCGLLDAVSDLPMLQVVLTQDSVIMWIDPNRLVSGTQGGRVSIVSSNGTVLGTLSIQVNAWVRAPVGYGYPEVPSHRHPGSQ